MIEVARARELVEAAVDSEDLVLGQVRELKAGWYFPCIAKLGHITGVVVNKQTGDHLLIYAESSLDLNLSLYDRGYQFLAYDLVILTIDDWDQTVRTLLPLHFMTTDTYYRYDRVWRVGRGLTEIEVRERLSTLPSIFTGTFMTHLHTLEQAREAGWFTFKALENRGRE